MKKGLNAMREELELTGSATCYAIAYLFVRLAERIGKCDELDSEAILHGIRFGVLP